ncbi:WXG100 family type VII secretion target [Rossellomorea aquimaris]|uniref:WXG100 family type VII secretion target n=1 Tax=Rossellomorea aquimaris TaxID=189382 RepID=UPI001CD5BDA6|nr:WXG100 family type VII secretion target [Rossellomorea aquimaris]MCA1054933.1 WXG100 family type VII secretion target [Rossellomorea aquimaris]
MANIRVTPEQLGSQGNELIKYAGDLSDILGLIDAKISEIIDGWDGLSQDAYFDMYTTMKQSLDQFPELVKSLGDATVSSAEAFSSVDEQLQSGFRSAQ